MSYHRYITDALVLGSEPSGEHSRRVVLFTRSYGLVYAHAQGLRSCRSRLRSHLATFTLSRASLVRGREMWRLVGALSGADDEVTQRALRPRTTSLLARVILLVRRLVPPDAPDEMLFERIVETFRFLAHEDFCEDELTLIEAIALSRVLFLLGYLDAGRRETEVARQSGWDRSTLPALAPGLPTLVGAINEALAASHL